MTTRRELFRNAGYLAATLTATRLGAKTAPRAAIGAAGSAPQTATGEPRPPLIRPPRLRTGDRIGLVNPATAAFETMPIKVLSESFAALGLEVVRGEHYFNRRGYFAGTDEERASDINRFFADSSIKALFARGGWGSARLLDRLDYPTIRANPKCLIGYSDVTALLLGIHARTGLVTFHGGTPRRRFSADYMKKVLFEGEHPLLLANPLEASGDELVPGTEDRVMTITPGKARGRILGGNLTVLTGILGSSYLPDWSDCILFVEDLNEAIYRIDRMLTQLRLAGVLPKVRGVVFGRCTDCDPGEGFGALTLEEVLRDHFGSLGVPAFSGLRIGHISEQFTIPLGTEVEIDADVGTMTLLESGVS